MSLGWDPPVQSKDGLGAALGKHRIFQCVENRNKDLFGCGEILNAKWEIIMSTYVQNSK